MRMNYLRIIAIAGIAVFVIAGIAISSDANASGVLAGVPPDAVILTAEETVDRDKQWYASHYGVSTEEATRRLALSPEISKLQVELRENEAGTFAGLWLDHKPRHQVVVRFTSNGNETIQPYLENSPWDGMVDVRTAAVSERTLKEAQRRATQIAKEINIDNDSSIDI